MFYTARTADAETRAVMFLLWCGLNDHLNLITFLSPQSTDPLRQGPGQQVRTLLVILPRMKYYIL